MPTGEPACGGATRYRPRSNGERRARTSKDEQGCEKTYAPISLKAPMTISWRYLPEGDRIIIADAL